MIVVPAILSLVLWYIRGVAIEILLLDRVGQRSAIYLAPAYRVEPRSFYGRHSSMVSTLGLSFADLPSRGVTKAKTRSKIEEALARVRWLPGVAGAVRMRFHKR